MVECYRLEGDTYRLEASGRDRDTLAVPGFDDLALTLSGCWLDG
jgi:hypothetical protein